MATKVTDPALLAALNGSTAAPARAKVTDPALLAQLNGTSAAAPADKSFLENASDQLSAGFTAGVNAIPFVGPQVLSGLEHVKAAVQGRSAEDVAATDKAQVEANPVAATVGSVAGPTVALAPIGLTSLGARALGMSGPLLERLGFGALSGGLIAGGDTVTRGGSLDEAKRNAMLGAGLGTVLPLAGAGLKAGFRAATGTAFDPAEKALARALSDDKIPVNEVQTRLAALGPDAVVADLGPNLQRQAGALASLPGNAQKTVREALEARAGLTNRRIIDDTNAVLGPSPVPSQVDAGIVAQQRALGPQYEALFQNKAKAVDTTALANDLDADIVNLRGDAQKAAKQVRAMLDVTGAPGNLDPNPRTLFETRQAIDGMLEGEASSKVSGYLKGVRAKVDAELAQAVPGIKAVDAKYADLAAQREALTKGQQLLDSGRTATRPEELNDMLAAATGGVSQRLTQGARAEIQRIIGTTANDLNALKTALKGDGSWNRDRLASLFGQDKADQFLHILEREKVYDATNSVVLKNSETAARNAAQAEFDAGTPSGVRNTTLTGIAASLAQKAANIGARTRRAGTNSKVAETLMSRNPSQRTLSAVERAMLERSRRGFVAPAVVPLQITVRGGQGN